MAPEIEMAAAIASNVVLFIVVPRLAGRLRRSGPLSPHAAGLGPISCPAHLPPAGKESRIVAGGFFGQHPRMDQPHRSKLSLEDGGFLTLVLVVTLAFAWLLTPYFGAILWGVVVAILFSPLYR